MNGPTVKGIVLAGDSGPRLHPITAGCIKQLVPIYDKPMIYYPLSTLMLAGIRDILIVSTAATRPLFEGLFGDGGHLGLKISYAVQDRPAGLAETFLIGRDFIADDACALVLGDSLFFGSGIPEKLQAVSRQVTGATIFAHWVSDPERYGVVTFGADGRVEGLVEKPATSTSHWAVTGLYFYDNRVVDIATGLTPSDRGMLEITDINRTYLEMNPLEVVKLGRGYAWFDTGTYDALLQAGQYVHTIETRQSLMIACLEEIALRMGFIDIHAARAQADALSNSSYGAYLRRVVDEFATGPQ